MMNVRISDTLRTVRHGQRLIRSSAAAPPRLDLSE
jgi:hypothetical protein